jgi:hypothetical protein
MSRVSAPTLVVAPAFVLAVSCQPGRLPTRTPNPESTACYALTYGAWSAWPSGDAGRAPVGLQEPLPDTIGLTRDVATTYNGRALYAVSTPLADSSHRSGYWLPLAADTVVVRFPASYGWALQLRLSLRGQGVEGGAGIFLNEVSDAPTNTVSAPVTGSRIPCPAGSSSSRAGA